MRIEFGLKLLAVVQEYKGKLELRNDAKDFLGVEFNDEELKYMLTLMGYRDEQREDEILPESLKNP